MFLPIKKQLDLISSFLNMPEFKWKAIVNDNRMIPFLSWYKDAINEIKNLSSLEVFLPDNIGFSLWKWYPSRGSKILKLYEYLSSKWLELDFEVIENSLYNKINTKIILLSGVKISVQKSKNIRTIKDYHKIINFNTNIQTCINSYLTVIKSDDNFISNNIKLYNKNYKKYVELKANLKYEKDIKYKEKLIKNFLDYRIFEFKNRVKFYKTLQSYWYTLLDDVFNWKKIDIKIINYYKNISIKKEKYIWKVHKVYNIVSSKQMKKKYIMIAENTNPEFINAFYKASFIAVETASELSHAAITCKELKIPLALGAKNIFLASENEKEININTNNKIINL